MNIIEEVREAIFPSNIYCLVCGSLIDRSRTYALCDKCIGKIHWITGKTCVMCGKALPDIYRGAPGKKGGNLCYDCMEKSHYFSRGWSCMTYGLHEREIMMDIKYNGKGYIAHKMGDVLFDKMEGLIEEAQEAGITPFDIIIPVPVSQKRMRQRGYNQSELMARQFIKRWKSKVREEQKVNKKPDKYLLPILESNVLLRQKETVMLRSLNPAERKLALEGAFGINSHMAEKISGKIVLLIDDIYTTGATADECSKVLINGGAEAVYLLTLCSGGNKPPDNDN